MEPIRTWLDFALLQTAAESYLDGIDLDNQNTQIVQGLIEESLKQGANRPTQANPNPSGSKRFTDVEAEWFTTNYTIVDHLENTDSGFSATVFKNKTTGEFTFSMRSTEYQFGELDEVDFGGDWARDGRPGADGEIAEVGFAFGQLNDMEEYLEHLKNGESWNADTEQWEENVRLDEIKNHLSVPTNKINVTGHSLSSHLATAFTMMHPEIVEHTYNFNAAGIGGIRDESSGFPFRETTGADISALMQTYQEMMDYNGTFNDPLNPPEWYVDLITNFNTDDAVNLFTEYNTLVNAAPGQDFENLYQNPLHLVVVAYLSNKVFPAGQGQTHIPFGGLGHNVIAGNNSSNIIDVSNTQLINIGLIDGGAGHDTIIGNADNNVIIGGTGQDTLNGGMGDDIFQISGTDSYYDKFNGGDGNDTVLGSDGDDVIRVHKFSGDNTVEIIEGGLGVNTLEGTNSSNTIDVSNTQLINIGLIDGGADHDTIIGNADNNVIIGGTGQDTLNGGAGDDTYQFAVGDSIDTIFDSNGLNDSVLFNNVSHDRLWFWQSGNDLRVGILNTEDKLTIQDWFNNPDANIETFNTSDDKLALLESNVQQLVDAMATFSAPNSGTLDVPEDIRHDVQSVITTAWQAA